MLKDFQASRSVCLNELQSLICLLNFTCLAKSVKKPHHHIGLSRGAKLDIMLWICFLEDFYGRSFSVSDNWETSQILQLYTDAAGSIGFGAIFDLWPENWKSYNIAPLELFCHSHLGVCHGR